jgi:hypothetical protein
MNRRKPTTREVAVCCPVCNGALTNLDGFAWGAGGIPGSFGAPASPQTRRNAFLEATLFCPACDQVRVLAFDQRKASLDVSWHDEEGKRLL